MELSQIRYFCSVAESQKLTATAEKLHVAQPALTQSIHRLEKELGVPLFAPKGRGIVLTPYGRFLLRRLTPALETLDRVPAELAAMADRERTTIHMNVLAASTLVTDSIIAYKREERHINFQLFQAGEMDVCDISVSTRFPERDPAPAENVCVFSEPIFLAVPEQGRYGSLRSIRLADAAGEEFVCLAGSKQFRSICDAFCARAGFRPRVIFESDSPFAVRNLIGAGMGVGFWPGFSWGRLDTTGMLRLPISDPACSRDLVVTRGGVKDDDIEVRRFFAFLRDFVARAAAEGTGPETGIFPDGAE